MFPFFDIPRPEFIHFQERDWITRRKFVPQIFKVPFLILRKGKVYLVSVLRDKQTAEALSIL